MKSIVSFLSVALLSLTPVTLVRAQTTPTPAAREKAATSSAPSPRTDVYHVHFNKAALGKAAALAEFLKTPDPQAPMPGHFILLRHQQGAPWDYVVIQHIGTKATVEAAG